MGKYFGTDGIRGVAGETLTPSFSYRVGQSLKKVFDPKQIVIGKDTRESSDVLALSIATGALEAGTDVLYAGTVSTPMVAHYAKEEGIIGVMITASHNPYQDNGIKVFDKGYKLSEKAESDIEAFLDSEETLRTGRYGVFRMNKSVTKAYEKLFETLNLEKANLQIAIDTANGATYEIAKKIFKPLADEHVQIGNMPNGRNINLECGSTDLKAIIETAAKNKSDIAFSFDGDGDRVLVVDHRENVYDGDLIVYIIATYLKKQNLLNKNTVVLTKMSNPGILRALKDQGIKVVQTDVGDKYVQAEMLKNDYTVGGENSGHIILNHLLQTGDGMLAAAYILKILHETRRTIASLVKDVEIYPQKTENVKNVDKKVVENKRLKQATKDVKKKFGADSLLLVRPSGTEPVVRITASHKDEAILDEAIETLKTIIVEEGREKDG